MAGGEFERTEAAREQLPTEAMLALQGGHKLEAIRIVRERTDLGLAEAKALVERAERHYRGEQEQRTRAGREESGVLRLLLIIVILAAVAAAVILL